MHVSNMCNYETNIGTILRVKTSDKLSSTIHINMRNKVANMIKSNGPSNPKSIWKVYLTKQNSAIPILIVKRNQSMMTLKSHSSERFLLILFQWCPTTTRYVWLYQSAWFWRCYWHWTLPKLSGSDGISATMLKQTVSIAPSITKLMNASIHSGKLPIAWKTSSVVQVPRWNNHSNYRRCIERHKFRTVYVFIHNI